MLTPTYLSLNMSMILSDQNALSARVWKILPFNVVIIVVSPFSILKAHGAALISVSLALSRTPAEATRPRIRGQCIAWYARLLPSFRWCSLTDPGGMARWVGVGTQQPLVGFEPTTPRPHGRKSGTGPLGHCVVMNDINLYSSQYRQTARLKNWKLNVLIYIMSSFDMYHNTISCTIKIFVVTILNLWASS